MILYTSGTTSRPKGVVTTHANIAAQIKSLVEAWEWSAERSHLALLAAAPRARDHQRGWLCAVVGRDLRDAAALRRQCRVGPHRRRPADPVHGGAHDLRQAHRRLGSGFARAPGGAKPGVLAGLRLMVSGSAALPVSTLERWQEISGHTLLERYGMTEIGMALSNPLRGERVPGSVGTPLPDVEVRLVREDGDPVAPGNAGRDRSPRSKRLRRILGPDQTPHAMPFAMAGFTPAIPRSSRTASTAFLVEQTSTYSRLAATKYPLWRSKRRCAEHPAVAECAVVGIPDAEWGERVAAAVVLKDGDVLDLQSLRTWARELLAAHKLPSRLLVVDALPRNAMGKVMKPALAALFQTKGADPVA